jgi:Mu transposase, C-terminal
VPQQLQTKIEFSHFTGSPPITPLGLSIFRPFVTSFVSKIFTPQCQLDGLSEVLFSFAHIFFGLYTDNGSDFTSRHLEQVCADLKIQLVFSTPGVPRGRGRIERFFSTVDQMFLCTLPGFKSSGGKRRLTLAEFDSLFREFILDTYNERLHGETGVAPIQRWEQGGFLPRMPDTLEQFDLLLLTVPTARKVHPDGIRFQGLRYVDTTLAAYIGESVMLRYDPRDAAEVRGFYNDRFLCRNLSRTRWRSHHASRRSQSAKTTPTRVIRPNSGTLKSR